MNGGHYEEAEAWQNWLLRALGGSPDKVQIMYGIKGEQRLTEGEIELARRLRKLQARCAWAMPRAEQVQLDIYGEMLDSFFHALHGLHRHDENDFRVLHCCWATWKPSGRRPMKASGRRAAGPSNSPIPR